MTQISVVDFIDVRHRARQLAMGDVQSLAVLPRGFADTSQPGPLIDQEATTIRKHFREANVALQVLGESNGTSTSILKSADWVAPVLFVGAGLWSQNPLAVDVAIHVIGSYATDMLKGVRTPKTVKLSIAVESTQGKPTKLLTYEGPVEGLGALTDAAKRIAND